MTEHTRHPLIARALDRSLPLEERRAAYRRWADEHQPHMHPALGGWHAHSGGDDRFHVHDHKEKPA